MVATHKNLNLPYLWKHLKITRKFLWNQEECQWHTWVIAKVLFGLLDNGKQEKKRLLSNLVILGLKITVESVAGDAVVMWGDCYFCNRWTSQNTSGIQGNSRWLDVACRELWHYAKNIFLLVCIRQHSSCCIMIYFEMWVVYSGGCKQPASILIYWCSVFALIDHIGLLFPTRWHKNSKWKGHRHVFARISFSMTAFGESMRFFLLAG